MAKYRHVQTSFWNDPKVSEEMTPEDRYFYLYLLTNEHTNQIGVYQITRKMMAFELGYTIESAKALMDRFINHHNLVAYNEETREICLINWGKYNLVKGGKPIEDCIKKELRTIKDLSLVQLVLSRTENEGLVKKINEIAGFDDTSHDTSTKRGQKEKEKEKEKENKKKDINTLSSEQKERSKDVVPYEEIVSYLNSKTGKSFKHQTPKTRTLINTRFKEGFTLEDFKRVIDIKVQQWKNDSHMSKYLKPDTLFTSKFEGYANERVNNRMNNIPGTPGYNYEQDQNNFDDGFRIPGYDYSKQR